MMYGSTELKLVSFSAPVFMPLSRENSFSLKLPSHGFIILSESIRLVLYEGKRACFNNMITLLYLNVKSILCMPMR